MNARRPHRPASTISDPRTFLQIPSRRPRGDPDALCYLWYLGSYLLNSTLTFQAVLSDAQRVSQAYTASIPGLQAEFGISNEVGILGLTTFTLALACGSLFWAPCSEVLGRKAVLGTSSPPRPFPHPILTVGILCDSLFPHHLLLVRDGTGSGQEHRDGSRLQVSYGVRRILNREWGLPLSHPKALSDPKPLAPPPPLSFL